MPPATGTGPSSIRVGGPRQSKKLGEKTQMESAAQNLKIVYDPLPSEALTRFISDNVVNLNFAKTGISEWHPVNFFLKNPRGEWLGGLWRNA
jgi:hypothetical protein